MVDMRVQGSHATVKTARRTNLRRNWVYSIDPKSPPLSNEIVELTLHLGHRRAIEISADFRAVRLRR